MKQLTNIVIFGIMAIAAGLPMELVWAGDSSSGNFSTVWSWQSDCHVRASDQLTFDNIKI